MGAQQSARATHFTNENEREEKPQPGADDEANEHHISISNKMVERLVEDALAVGGTATAKLTPGAAPRIEPTRDRDKILSEKLRELDNSHSERLGLTCDEVRSTARRVEMRATNILRTSQPVCEECEERLIECYNSCPSPTDAARCYEAVGEYRHCVQEAAVARLRARGAREAEEARRLTRHVARAREHHVLKDFTLPNNQPNLVPPPSN